MVSMETFLIGAAGGAVASLALNKANEVAARWKSTEAALMSHDAAIGALVANLAVDTAEDKPPQGGQYL